MNRTEKQKVLHNVFQGQKGQLQELHIQKRKDAMPLRHVHGIVDIHQCPPEFLDIMVLGGMEKMIDNKLEWEPLREWIRHFNEYGSNFKNDTAFGVIDGNDKRFHKIDLAYIFLQHRNYQTCVLAGGTVARLRHYYDKSAQSIDGFIMVISFETNPSSGVSKNSSLIEMSKI